MKQPEPTTSPLVEKLLTLTVMVNDAVVTDRIDEIDALLGERQTTLDLIGQSQLSPQDVAIVQKAQSIEAMALEGLLTLRNDSTKRFQGLSRTKSGLASYRVNR